MRTFLLRVLLKIGWSVGGVAEDGLPRLGARDVQPLLAALGPGDFVLLGNNGLLSHVAVAVGEGRIVHAMATEKTMRGWLGSFYDALWRALGTAEPNVGVVEEALLAFLERYERDTWVIVRHPALTDDERGRGLAHVRGLVGRPYDYGFRDANEALYCTEIVVEFLRAALAERAPRLQTRRVRVPFLLDAEVVEPAVVLDHPELRVVAGNDAARRNYARQLTSG